FMLLSLLKVSAEVSAQVVTLNVKNASIKEVFRVIKKQTGYDFLYASSDLKAAKPVTLNLQKASLFDALDKCLSNQHLSYEIKQTTILSKRETVSENRPTAISLLGEALQRKIRGVVLDVSGNPLSGAAVSWEGSDIATATDETGAYSITQ